MRKEDRPSTPGLYRFVGERKVSLVRSDIQQVDEVVLVEKYVGINGYLDFCVRRFGTQKMQSISMYQGVWYFIGDEIERITSDIPATPAA